MGYRGRDVEVTIIEKDLCLVVACDSCGAVGDKDLDILKVPPQLVGRLTARVSLMEVLCTGALPRIMTVAVSSESDPTGNGILQGVRAELESAGFKDLPLAISTEKNFIPRQTGLGIGLTGTCREQDLRIAGSKSGDLVYCLGLPKVGEEVAATPDAQSLQTIHIRNLPAHPGIHDIVPVGSRGILAEADQLAHHTRNRFLPDVPSLIDLNKSAGPATCAIFTCAPGVSPGILFQLPLTRVGRFAPIATD